MLCSCRLYIASNRYYADRTVISKFLKTSSFIFKFFERGITQNIQSVIISFFAVTDSIVQAYDNLLEVLFHYDNYFQSFTFRFKISESGITKNILMRITYKLGHN
jgi:hypothetical protein